MASPEGEEAIREGFCVFWSAAILRRSVFLSASRGLAQERRAGRDLECGEDRRFPTFFSGAAASARKTKCQSGDPRRTQNPAPPIDCRQSIGGRTDQTERRRDRRTRVVAQ